MGFYLKNLEGYYQETGRGGRDGLQSDCILFYSYGDRVKIEYFIGQKEGAREREVAYRKLKEMTDYCEGNICRRKVLLGYFGEAFMSLTAVDAIYVWNRGGSFTGQLRHRRYSPAFIGLKEVLA